MTDPPTVPRPGTPALLLGSCLWAGCEALPDATDGTVVVIVMDGVRAGESFGTGPSEATGEPSHDFLPRLWDEVASTGVRLVDLWNVGTTTTTPAHVDLVGARRQFFANYALDDGVGLYRPDWPMLPERLLATEGDDPDRVVLLGNTHFLGPLSASIWPGADDHAATWRYLTTAAPEDRPVSDETVLEAVRRSLEEDQPRLLVANLHAVDRAGHYGSHDAHLDAVRGLDDGIADLHAWIRETDAFADDTWVLITTDHGRHDHADSDPVWRHHGCSCNGCRHISAVLTGPGVRPDVVWDQPVTLSDLGATLAALLGADLPFAEGVVLGDLFDDPPDLASRRGVAEVAEAGGHAAEGLWIEDDLAHRSEVRLDGEPVSSPDAFAAEHPVMATDGERTWLCFRELLLTPDEPDTAWTARCLEDPGDGVFADMGPPLQDPGPFWDPVLVPDGAGRVHVVYPYNPNGTATGGKENGHGEVGIEVATWDGEGWTVGREVPKAAFPTEITAVLHDDALVLAAGASPAGLSGRYHRDVYRTMASPGTAEPWRWAAFEAVGWGPGLVGKADWRMERPALRVDDAGTLHLAAIGITDQGNVAALATSADRGDSWDDPALADLPGPVLPHLTPVWIGDRAVFAVEGDEGALLCGVAPDTAATCADLGSPRIQALAPAADGVRAVVDAGIGDWIDHPVPAADLGVEP